MVNGEELIKEFGLGRFTHERQTEIVEQYTYELGAALEDGLRPEQVEEFTQIINGDDTIITAWLAANAPGYREDPSFSSILSESASYDSVSAEKVYASIGWIRVNRPDFETVTDAVKQEFKTALDAEAAGR